jgi:hypothetical protein
MILHFNLCKYVIMYVILYIHLVLCKFCYYVYIISYVHLVCTNTLLKKLELQNSIWFYLSKPNNDPIHFEKIYLVHFKTHLNDFCGLGCARYIITK